MPATPTTGRVSWVWSAGSVAAKVAVVALFFALGSIVYDLTNAYGSATDRATRFVRPCDRFPGILQPWTAVVYLFGGVALPIVPFCFHRRWPAIRFVLACYAVAAAIAFVTYWAWPTRMDRPAFDGADLGSRLMRWVQSVDDPANCCPSSHAIFAVLGAILVGHGGAGRLIQAASWGLAAAVCTTTITTGQHYFVDVLGGGATAIVAYTVARLGFSASSDRTP